MILVEFPDGKKFMGGTRLAIVEGFRAYMFFQGDAGWTFDQFLDDFVDRANAIVAADLPVISPGADYDRADELISAMVDAGLITVTV